MKKQYGLWANLLFLLRQMKRYSRRSFRMIWLSIPMKVALPFIGILLPNLVVQAITEQGNVAGLMLAVLTLAWGWRRFSAAFWSSMRRALWKRSKASFAKP